MGAFKSGDEGLNATEQLKTNRDSVNGVKMNESDVSGNIHGGNEAEKKPRPIAPPKPKKYKGTLSASQVLLEENEETEEGSKLYSNKSIPIILPTRSNNDYPVYSLRREYAAPLIVPTDESPSPYRSTTTTMTLPLTVHSPRNGVSTNTSSSQKTNRAVSLDSNGAALNQMNLTNSRRAPVKRNAGEYKRLRRVAYLRGKVLTDSYKVFMHILFYIRFFFLFDHCDLV